MFYKVFEVEEGIYIDNEGKMYDIFEGYSIKVPNGLTIEECGWFEANNIDEVLQMYDLRMREDFQ